MLASLLLRTNSFCALIVGFVTSIVGFCQTKVEGLKSSLDDAESQSFSAELKMLDARSKYLSAVLAGKDKVDEYIAQFHYKVGADPSSRFAPPIRNYMDLKSCQCLESLAEKLDKCEDKAELLTISKDLGTARKPMQALVANITATLSELVSARDAKRKKKNNDESKRKGSMGESGAEKKVKRKIAVDIFELVSEVCSWNAT